MTGGPTVGILGGGQLGRMLALAGYPLGLTFRFFDLGPAPAGDVGPLVPGSFEDSAALARFADGLAVATYEFENVPVDAARLLAERVPVYPPPGALEAGQDRLGEKSLFTELGIRTPAFAPVDTRESLDAAVAAVGLPAVLKTRRLGYDGKGQALIREPAEAAPAWERLGGAAGVPLILEQFIDFTRELSILAVRSRSGEEAFYPLVQNTHRGGILRESIAPAPSVAPGLQAEAESYARRLLQRLDYAGVLALELFEHRGALLANEMAPRVHNSGHWTIEGAETSQFENHLRAILDLSLGSTAPRGHAAMVNLIGAAPDSGAVLACPGAHLHLYGKPPRPGRKLGHITVRADDAPALERALAPVRALAAAASVG